MKSIDKQFKQMVEDVPSSVKIEVDLSFAIAGAKASPSLNIMIL